MFEVIRRAGPGHLVHGFTYSGNPLSAAVGLEVLDILHEEQLVERVERSGRMLMDRLQPLRELPMIGDIRGRGLLVGIEFVADRLTRTPFLRNLGIAWQVQQAALDRGLWIYGGTGSDKGIAGDHILIAPPYIITEAQIDELVERLTAALDTVQRGCLGPVPASA